jgi:hypothetical protein
MLHFGDTEMKVAACIVGILASVIGGPSLAQDMKALAGPGDWVKSWPVEQQYIPIALGCPSSKDSGLLELEYKNRVGERLRVQAFFRNSAAESIRIEIAAKGEQLQLYRELYPDEATPTRIQDYLEFSSRMKSFKTVVCDAGDADRKIFFQLLEANKTSLQ